MPAIELGEALERLVVVSRSPGGAPAYGDLPQPVEAPELPGGKAHTVAQAAVRRLLLDWGLDGPRLGGPGWNPLGAVIPSGARVLIKPNWVLHWNQSGHGLECLVTHPSFIEAVARYVALAKPSRLVIGDAPIQGCDFTALRAACDLDGMAERLRRGTPAAVPVEILDFRRTVLMGHKLGDPKAEDLRDLKNFVLFDLGGRSLLEPLAGQSRRFRVTMYNPGLLRRTHAPGRHQYLVAREAIEADVIVNLPKLKSHKKTCITGALKNLIGVNGNKEYLPHHRKGGQLRGGDCYPGGSWLKSRAEDLLDLANRRRPGMLQRLLARAAELVCRGAGAPPGPCGENGDLEGSWHGNDTVWRTCLDLQRILRYGRADGTLSDSPQRLVITLTDAIVGGEGEGPLANTPVPSGFVAGGLNPAAVEWVQARLMGFDPARIALTREAFGAFPYPLADFPASDIQTRQDGRDVPVDKLGPLNGRAFLPPSGWRGHCELQTATAGRANAPAG
jgi:uncharacterized protein (DUF362 family)